MTRVLIVANRLPVTAGVKRGRISLTRAPGGLATGLSRVQAAGGSLWIGWPGTRGRLSETLETDLMRRLGAKNLVGVPLEPEEVEGFYEGFANEVLWPTFHYLLDRMPLKQRGWDVYERVNDRFAEICAHYLRPDDVVWIHDYHLMRMPALLRRRSPDAKIGFFLHVPFPPSDLFQTLAHREDLLDGLLGADVIGFHTTAYVRHFAAGLLRLRGLQVDIDHVRIGDRIVRIGAFPMGVDADRFRMITSAEGFDAEVAALRSTPECATLLGVDRLDYTKGLLRRLLAFERLLGEHPELHGRVRLIQVAAPSRAAVGSYRELRNQVERLVGQIHGAFATPSWVPVHYINRGLSEREVAALYRSADVMLVTPLRDGMNLVAKEFVAARTDGDGVLVLSEFAGAAAELGGAILVNPYDIDAVAEAVHQALTMPAGERRQRMSRMRARVEEHDLQRWAREFVHAVEGASQSTGARTHEESTGLDSELSRVCDARRLVVVLDYDGTLVPFALRPELAPPDRELLDMLRRLALSPATEVHIASGRARETMSEWFGSLPVYLHAEHGLATRHPRARGWRTLIPADLSWRERVRAILEQFAGRTPGAFVEVKRGGLAWHWRAAADPAFAERQADELRLHLSELLMSSSATLLPGDKVIEIRPAGSSKAAVVLGIADRVPDGTEWLVLGDDTTDEEMFASLPGGAVSIHVGPEPTRARFRVPDVTTARALLLHVVEQRETRANPHGRQARGRRSFRPVAQGRPLRSP